MITGTASFTTTSAQHAQAAERALRGLGLDPKVTFYGDAFDGDGDILFGQGGVEAKYVEVRLGKVHFTATVDEHGPERYTVDDTRPARWEITGAA